MRKTLIPVFPGTNCEQETLNWFSDNLETEAQFLNLETHGELCASDIDAIAIPGGFSYGDYLRAGAIAARSKEMTFIKKMSALNVPLIGICNGFQILCESGLLPGVLVKNVTREHHHFPVEIKIDSEFFSENNTQKKSAWIPKLNNNDAEYISKQFSQFLLPMSCGMGNWRPPLSQKNYDVTENVSPIYYINNENGSFNSIAGIINKQNGNILGLMPHPERASDPVLGSIEGLIFLLGLSQSRSIKIKSKSALDMFTMKLNQKDFFYD